jgi:hypothetical protein
LSLIPECIICTVQWANRSECSPDVIPVVSLSFNKLRIKVWVTLFSQWLPWKWKSGVHRSKKSWNKCLQSKLPATNLHPQLDYHGLSIFIPHQRPDLASIGSPRDPNGRWPVRPLRAGLVSKTSMESSSMAMELSSVWGLTDSLVQAYTANINQYMPIYCLWHSLNPIRLFTRISYCSLPLHAVFWACSY